MKNFIRSVQNFGQKAVQVAHAVEAAPAQAAQLRQAVIASAGQLKQIHGDVQASIKGLHADNEDHLASALREINDDAEIFSSAGYSLAGVELELSPVQRLIVHLDKTANFPNDGLQSLLAATATRPTTVALLNALVKAEAIREKLELPPLRYQGLIVHVGPTPTIRLRWTAKTEKTEPDSQSADLQPAQPHTQPPPIPSSSAFAQPSSYFERRPLPPAPTIERIIESPVNVQSPEPPATPAVTTPTRESDWKTTALDRFKTMPGASKYRR